MLPLLGSFFVISLSGALSPGPLTTMAIAEGSRRSKWSGLWLSVGHGLIEGVYVALIALILWLGRDTLLQQPFLIGAIALIGGGFLGWMGAGMAVGAWRKQLTLADGPGETTHLSLIPKGIFVSLSNPFWWIWWVLVATVYIGQSLAWGIGGVAILFFVHWLTDLGWLTGLSWLTASGHGLINPAVYRWILIICGAVLLFFGLSFISLGLQILSTGQLPAW